VSKLRVEIVYALPEAQYLIELDMTAGATIEDALNRVRATPGFADVDLDHASVGIFGTVVADRAQRLNEGDRVEIYRPLTIDPMAARRLRANQPAE
jgi:uncharacterized protein